MIFSTRIDGMVMRVVIKRRVWELDVSGILSSPFKREFLEDKNQGVARLRDAKAELQAFIRFLAGGWEA